MALQMKHCSGGSKLEATVSYVDTSRSPLPDRHSDGIGCARRSAFLRYRYVFCAVLLTTVFLLAGCTRIWTRLDISFKDDPLGRPRDSPSPTPPRDKLTSPAGQLTSSAVVANPAGGKWLRITPSPKFLAAMDQRELTTIATSERFNTNPPAQIRGSLRLRLDGPGAVTVGFRAEQGGNFTDILAGIQIFKSPFSTHGQVYMLPGFRIERIKDIYMLPSRGEVLTSYLPGKVIDIFWSIDQSSRTISVGAGGPSESMTYWPFSSNGVENTPIMRLSLWIWLEKPSNNTVLFIDRLQSEEYK